MSEGCSLLDLSVQVILTSAIAVYWLPKKSGDYPDPTQCGIIKNFCYWFTLLGRWSQLLQVKEDWYSVA